MDEILKDDLSNIRKNCIDIKNGLTAGRTQRKDRKEYIDKLDEILKWVEDIGRRNIHIKASERYQKDKEGL